MGAREGSLLHVLGTTADGMVAVAPGGGILTWNDGAAALLGYSADEVLGKPCYEVFEWLDRCGNPICSALCPHCRPAGSDEQVQTREVIARAKGGRALWLTVSTIVPPPELRHEYRLVHLFREVGLPPELERLVAERLSAGNGAAVEVQADAGTAAALERLTPREREVLELLADGRGSKEIAQRLAVSLATVRNHIQHILEKLGAHSKLEAALLFTRHVGPRPGREKLHEAPEQ